MRVAVISDSFFESTFPLVKALAQTQEVDLYCVLSMNFLNSSMFDISVHSERLRCGIYTPEQSSSFIPEHTLKYFEDTGVRIHIVIFSGAKQFLHDIQSTIRFRRLLKRSNYDVYHFIGTQVFFPFIESALRNRNLVHTLHESITRLLTLETNPLKRFFFKRLFKLLDKGGVKIIFHSDNVRNEHHSISATPLGKTTVIPFGFFEGYWDYQDVESLEIPQDKYALFVGYIHPYKGVDLLIEANKKLREQGVTIPLVIAGKDATNIEGRFNLDSNIHFINRFLTESELVTLIKSCHAVLLPYTSSSQSGIPNTCFCFNKPVVASDLEGIKTIVFDEVNGLLFKNKDVDHLVEAIRRLWVDTDLYETLSDNIGNRKKMEWTSWELIMKTTLEFYKAS